MGKIIAQNFIYVGRTNVATITEVCHMSMFSTTTKVVKVI